MLAEVIEIVPEEEAQEFVERTPQVGLFWWNPRTNMFIVTEKIPAAYAPINEAGERTLPYSFEYVWRRHRMRGDYRKIPHGRVLWNVLNKDYRIYVIGAADAEYDRNILANSLAGEFMLTMPKVLLPAEPKAESLLISFALEGFNQVRNHFFKNNQCNWALFKEINAILEDTECEIGELLHEHFKNMEQYKKLCPAGFKKQYQKSVFKDI